MKAAVLVKNGAAATAFEIREVPKPTFAADEVLLSSASKEVLPVVTIDGKAIANGKPGPIYKKLYAAYQTVKIA